MSEKYKNHRRVCLGLFLIYIVMLTYFLFFSEGFGREVREGYSYNLIPFKEIKRFYKYRHVVGIKSFLINIVGNVICFMPFGFLFPIINGKGRKWYNTILAAFLLSLSVEVMQLVFKVGSFDVDDMFLNTLGGVLGYICFSVLRLFGRSWNGRSK